jgi:hypothetical protein
MDVERELDDTFVKLLVIRAIVSRLLAYEAARHREPDAVFCEISEAVEKLLARHTKGIAVLDLEEGVRREVDWFVAAAKSWL